MEITTIFTVFVVVFTSIILAFLYYLYFWGYSKGELSRKKISQIYCYNCFLWCFWCWRFNIQYCRLYELKKLIKQR